MVETEDLLGVDIALDSDYNLIFNSNNAFTTTKGKNNLSQAIINRLLTPIESNEFYPRYGSYLHRINKKSMINSTLIYAKQVVYECLLQEPRISTIDNIECKFITIERKNYLNINIIVTPINSTEPFNFVYDYFLS